jgi:hypothetical protein
MDFRMAIEQSISDVPFSERLLATLDHIEYRRIQSQEDFEDIARLRYKAYKARDVLPVAAKNLIDDVDFDRQAYVFGVYYYEQLVSTLRIHHVTPDHRVCQSSGIFPEAINDFLDAGLTLIDPARFAVDPALGAEASMLPYLTVRPTIIDHDQDLRVRADIAGITDPGTAGKADEAFSRLPVGGLRAPDDVCRRLGRGNAGVDNPALGTNCGTVGLARNGLSAIGRPADGCCATTMAGDKVPRLHFAHLCANHDGGCAEIRCGDGGG